MRWLVRSPLLVSAALLLVSGPVASARGDSFQYEAEEHTCANGLRVVLIPWDAPGVVSYTTLVRAGAGDAIAPGFDGLPELIRRLVVSGAREPDAPLRLSTPADLPRPLARALSYSDDDVTVFTHVVPRETLSALIEREARRFRTLTIDADSPRREAEGAARWLRKRLEAPEPRLEREIRSLAYTTLGYRTGPVGSPEGIERTAADLEAVRSSLGAWYRPERIVLVVVGDFERTAVRKRIESAYGTWPRGGGEPARREEPPQTARRERTLSVPGLAEPWIRLSYAIPARFDRDPDVPPLAAVAEGAFGVTGPLYQALVRDERTVAELRAETFWCRDAGRFDITARLAKQADIADVRSRLESALITASREPMSKVRLLAVSDRLRYNALARLDRVDGVARMAVLSLTVTGHPNAWGPYFAALLRLEPADLQRVAGRYLVPSRQTAVILRPEAQPR